MNKLLQNRKTLPKSENRGCPMGIPPRLSINCEFSATVRKGVRGKPKKGVPRHSNLLFSELL